MGLCALVAALSAVLVSVCVRAEQGELLQNGGFEARGAEHWGTCWGYQCDVVTQDDGGHALKASHRTHSYQGPGQQIHPRPGHTYRAQSWFKLLNDKQGVLGQTVQLEVSFKFPDGQSSYINVALKPYVTAADGWVYLDGTFLAPTKQYSTATFYHQGPAPGVDFMVDNAAVSEVHLASQSEWRAETDKNIDLHRKANIRINVNTADGIDRSEVQIRVVQQSKAFPFGTCVNSRKYLDTSVPKYADFIHQHFNWAVPENALKWTQLEPRDGVLHTDRALRTIQGLKSKGLKVRGHNMVWSVGQFVPSFLKSLSGDALRARVKQHIQWTLNLTVGMLEHWDVNNENLHGQWYQNALHDRDYDLELFREMYAADPQPKLFLNDYSVVGSGAATTAYRDQGKRFKAANVHLYGMGVQSHFSSGVEPNPTLIKQRLDTLAEVGVPLWATELDVRSDDENQRADWYEQALRALYGHPSVEGVLFWGFWGDIQSGGQAAALVTGPELKLTAAGRRVLDLLEREWMTDVTSALPGPGPLVVRAFHGTHEARVVYKGRELPALTQTLSLGPGGKTININVHT